MFTCSGDRIRTWAQMKAHGPSPLSSAPARSSPRAMNTPHNEVAVSEATTAAVVDGPKPAPVDVLVPEKQTALSNFFFTLRDILFSSVINVLLIFVPVGMAVHFIAMPAGVVFAMNAIAIIPLAGLLSHATESVASQLGDTVGALMNVTFGNAVELIIFMYASLVGSILANLLLILGMCFFLGGLRFREQIYNSTVTQMSSCLLSLSVISLLLPTAFHASFLSVKTANDKVLQVSRGTSVILLLVYFLYIFFQLRSHSYMYESTPQEIIERESLPGPAAQYFNSAATSEPSSSSGSESDDSARSVNTATRIRRMVRGKKSSYKRSLSSHQDETTDPAGTPASGDNRSRRVSLVDDMDAILPNDDTSAVETRDRSAGNQQKKDGKRHARGHKHRKAGTSAGPRPTQAVTESEPTTMEHGQAETRRVDFAHASDLEAQAETSRTRPFSLRTLRTSVFVASPINPVAASSVAAARYPHHPLQRARSLPVGRQPRSLHVLAASDGIPPIVPIVVHDPPRTSTQPGNADNLGQDQEHKPQTSRTTAILLLLVSTGLVAVCAEFMVDSISEVVADGSGVSEAFVGLILLPVVGNAAEHVTAVSVALKNKMDLAIGVALGSSIQIALFVTPLVVLLGWAMGKDQMSLFFTLFETICMFVSTFIVNFLVLDGRSNYLEGALLCSAYVIIGVAAFFSPNEKLASPLGGGVGGNSTNFNF
ncbi:vacuolar calcium ion transporter [Podospora appendiculata]|uniref:Vacuolar calcium ion transporter n=1 Tax=Podospora appendiculata TaxID=314037 RepID=A0AAE1CHE4_9PEZI|nr:vacuolar calcium ion transporter [Podospora appendiculata]